MQWKWVDPQTAEQGQSLLRRLTDQGYEGYFVGGCVRDELMGRPVNDMDIATNATPEQVMALFERTIPTGLEHGTITVLIENEPFEVTTYRTETEYVDHRRPEQVQFVRELSEDLRRRDFTMNAIARGIDGEYVDPFHGIEDLRNGIIRCVGIADERFEEDALRMVRGIRFASVFDFEIEQQTWQALLNHQALIKHIATERIRVEMEKMIAGPYPYHGIELLLSSGLIPYMKVDVPCEKLNLDLLRSLESLPSSPLVLRWTLIALALGMDEQQIKQYFKSWTFPNTITDQASKIVRMNQRLYDGIVEQESVSLVENEVVIESTSSIDQSYVRFVSCVLDYGKEIAQHWRTLYAVLSSTQQQRLSTIGQQADSWLEQLTIYSLADLPIKGQEVLEYVKIPAGKWLGELFNEILLVVATGQLENNKEAILHYADQALVRKGLR
ncbi:Polynucleotide adenylyltransferase [Paenibacillus nuruki]|uniref:Polynucleotide adenylyltransferase n=1 Tax=Paenibacillus nuruki TaxID=1886670 RepID=A0A1E3L361_9BACL|nr:CCA tRNA nucleotidyltransferase [Paenibacillus nuruki]ODP28114.1 Polynucleotide adenylyltransferase [Paenibacillus nuruki]